MTLTAPKRHQVTRSHPLPRAERATMAPRIGYLVTIVSSAALLYLINVSPSWHALPLLTSAILQAIGLLNVFLAVAIVVNAVFIFHDPPLFKAMGEYVIGSFGLALLLRIWMVFPFDFNGLGGMPAVTIRSLLIFTTAATVVGLSARLVGMRKMIEA